MTRNVVSKSILLGYSVLSICGISNLNASEKTDANRATEKPGGSVLHDKFNKMQAQLDQIADSLANALDNDSLHLADAKSSSGNNGKKNSKVKKNSTPCNPDWRVQLMDKGGRFEVGAEALLMTSTLSNAYSDEILVVPHSPAPLTIFVQNSNVARIKPDYNFGFALDMRYRAKTNNDIGVYYKYLRNNGHGTFKSDDIVPVNLFGEVTEPTRIVQDDSGHSHSHMHLADFMFGRTYALSEQTIIRVSGGLSYYNLHCTVNYQDFDISSTVGVVPAGTIEQQVIAVQRNKYWGLGPKLGFDLEYYFLPRCWNHDFNMFLNTEIAAYYTKEWSHGDQFTATNSLTDGQLASTNTISTNWRNEPGFELTPNVNLNMGMKYGYHTSGGYDLIFTAGYRVLAFFYMDELFRRNVFTGRSEDVQGLFQRTALDDTLVYSGPYVRFSFGY